MKITQSSAAPPRDALSVAIASLTAQISNQLSNLVQQSLSADGSPSGALAAVADDFAAVLDLLRRTQEDLTAQGDDVATTLNALERVRRRYHDLFEYAPDAYLVTDADSRILEANQAAIRLIGYSRIYAYGRPLRSFVAPGSAHAVTTHLRALQEAPAEEPATWEMTFRSRGRGPHRAVQARVRRMTDHTGSQTLLLWLLRRIPPEAQPRPAASDEPASRNGPAEAWLRVILQTVPDATLLLGADGQIRTCNSAAVRLLGSAIGRSLEEALCPVMHPDDRIRATRALLRGGRPLARSGATRFRLRRSDGAWREVEAVTARIPAQLDLPGMILSLRDITEQTRTHRAFDRFYAYRAVAEALFADPAAGESDEILFERVAGLSVPLLGDACRIYLRGSDDALRLVAAADRDRDRRSFANEDGSLHLHRVGARPDLLDQVLHQGAPVLTPEPTGALGASIAGGNASPAGGQSEPAHSTLMLPLQPAGNETIGVLMLRCAASVRRYGEEDLLLGQDLARQISLLLARTRLARQARQVDAVTRARTREQGEALARTVESLHRSLHGLRTALTAVPSPADAGAPDGRDEMLEQIAADAARLESQIATMLDALGNTDDEPAGQRRSVAVVTLVREVIAEHDGRPLQVFTHGSIPSVRAHPERLRQVLKRVLQFADQTAAEEAPLHIRITASNATVTIVVAPSGRGELLPHGQPSPLSPDGVLYPARSIVEAHGGTLACASSSDGARSITITLPADAEVESDRDRGQERRPRGTGGRISHREREVLGLLEQGLTNRQIAEHLFLSERTVEHHISRMLARFRLSTRTHLAAFALKHDLTGTISPDEG